MDVDALAEASEELSGADLKRIVDDGKLLFAFARSRNVPPQPATVYFLTAIETVRKNKEQYAAAESRARARHSTRRLDGMSEELDDMESLELPDEVFAVSSRGRHDGLDDG